MAHYALNIKQLLDRGNLIMTDVVTKGVAGVSSVTDGVRNKLKGAVGWLFGMEKESATTPAKPDLTLVKPAAADPAAAEDVVATA